MHARTILCAVVAFLGGSSLPWAGQVIFRASAEHVAVEVVVTDSKEQPVGNLTKDDFVIEEKGRSQQIADFEFVSLPLRHTGLAQASEATPIPDVASNVPAAHDSRQFVVVIDDLHLLPFDITSVERVLTEVLGTIEPHDEVAVVFVRRADLSLDFTRDPERLQSAVANLKAALDAGEDLPRRDELSKSESDDALASARATAFVLKNVVSALRGSSYIRRAVLYVGTYSVLDPTASIKGVEKGDADVAQRYLNDAFAAARTADVPIYTLDPRGMATPELNTIGPPVTTPRGRANMAHRIIVQQDHLGEIAVNTGGRAFINRSNLVGAVDEMMTENGAFYRLGYYPEPFLRDGRFHEIAVRVKRDGLHVRARSGYVASASSSGTDLQTTLNSALSSELNVEGLRLNAVATPVALGAHGAKAVAAVEVLYPAPLDGSKHIDDDLELRAVAFDSDGKVQASSSREWHLSAKVPDVDFVRFLADDSIDLPARPLKLRLVVASKALGTAGSVQLAISPFEGVSSDLRMGGVVLGLVGEPREPALGANLLVGLVPFQPTAERSFKAGDVLRVFTRFVCSSAQSAVHASVAVQGAGGTERPFDLAVTDVAAGQGQATLDISVPLAGLSPGEHSLEVGGTLGVAPRVTRRVAFQVR